MAPAKKTAAKKPAKKVASKRPAIKRASEVARDRKPTARARDAAREKLHTMVNEGIGNAKPLAKGRIMRASAASAYRVIPTGSIKLDVRLGVGGYVRGRIAELWGMPGMGKTTMALLAIAEAQRAYPDELCAFVDVEGTFDKLLAARLGVDLDRLDLFVPSNAEEVADLMKTMIRQRIYSMISLDSIGAMIPEIEKEKDADESVVANQAKIVTRMVKIITSEAPVYDVAVLIINQVRADIGIGGHGPQTTTAGGWALKHHSTHKLKVGPGGAGWQRKVIVDGVTHVVGQNIAIEVERNKVGVRGGVARFDLFIKPTHKFGPRGLRPAQEALELGQERTVRAIIKNGSRYTLPDGQVVTGEAKALEALQDDPELVAMVREIALRSVANEVVIDAEPLLDDAPDGEFLDEAPVTDPPETPTLVLNGASGLPIFRGIEDFAPADDLPLPGVFAEIDEDPDAEPVEDAS